MVRSFSQWTKTLSFPSRLSPQKHPGSSPSVISNNMTPTPSKDRSTPISTTPDQKRLYILANPSHFLSRNPGSAAVTFE
ncbi:unnamed protein product [Bemisia tabaci]|uniref:Uncharacterized protein n=1 Tax=Bemisia tabaci TaxID=7038 RepID=A0A9P0EW77_BEMTA|nr:unnamed protein product [Bemisia tabaci]